MGIAPLLAGLPVPFQLSPELLARLDLLADQHGLFGAQIPRPRLPSFDPRDAVVRAVTRLPLTLLFLVPDVFTNNFFIQTYRGHEVAPRPETLPREVTLAPQEVSSYRNCAFPLHEAQGFASIDPVLGVDDPVVVTPELTACVRRAMFEQVGALVLGTSLQPAPRPLLQRFRQPLVAVADHQLGSPESSCIGSA